MRLSSIIAVLLLFGCQPPTQLIVRVDSDLDVPDELASVQAIVTDERNATVGAEFFDLARYGLPLSFGIEGGELADEQVRIVIQGLTRRDELLVERIAAVEFVAGEKRLLPIFLARSCVGVRCQGGETCSERGCVSPIVDVRMLPTIEPGDELLFDAGVHPDAGPSPDATVPDEDAGADPDAGMPVECTATVECGVGMVCIEPSGGGCDGTETCVCKSTCAALTPDTGCGADEECLFRPPQESVCLDRDLSTAPDYRAPCTTRLDCDVYANYFCRHVSEGSPGECTSLCLDNEYCDVELPGTFCDRSVFGTQQFGLCLEPPTPISDVGNPCLNDSECQAGRCIPGLNACTAPCSGLTACPPNSLCAISLNGNDAWCVQSCFDDVDCANNPSFICRDDYGFGSPGLCFFPCDEDMYPCASGLVCDVASGRCI